MRRPSSVSENSTYTTNGSDTIKSVNAVIECVWVLRLLEGVISSCSFSQEVINNINTGMINKNAGAFMVGLF
jgi:hypothetical protein